MRTFLIKSTGLVAAVALVAAGLGAPPASADSPPQTFRGTANGRDRTHTIDLQPGLVVVRAKHSGATNFILVLILPKPGIDISREYDESIHLINEIGQYNGGAAGKVRKAGAYILDIQASGSYEIIVEQPPLSQVAEPGLLDFTGKGQQVTPVIMLPPGLHRISFTHDGVASYGPNGAAFVYLYDMNGNTVAGQSGRLFNERGPFTGEVTLEIILDGPHIFEVDATGSWTLRID